MNTAIQQETDTDPTFCTTPGSLITDREREVLILTGRGLKAKEVAAELRISLKTVESHRANIKVKLGIKNGDFIYFAVRYVCKFVETQ